MNAKPETQTDRAGRAALFTAIRQGRAYLTTYIGRRKVVGYNPRTGWAVTNNRDEYTDQRSFLVCEEDIHIDPDLTSFRGPLHRDGA